MKERNKYVRRRWRRRRTVVYIWYDMWYHLLTLVLLLMEPHGHACASSLSCLFSTPTWCTREIESKPAQPPPHRLPPPPPPFLSFFLYFHHSLFYILKFSFPPELSLINPLFIVFTYTQTNVKRKVENDRPKTNYLIFFFFFTWATRTPHHQWRRPWWWDFICFFYFLFFLLHVLDNIIIIIMHVWWPSVSMLMSCHVLHLSYGKHDSPRT